jgi:hypothetical protein
LTLNSLNLVSLMPVYSSGSRSNGPTNVPKHGAYYDCPARTGRGTGGNARAIPWTRSGQRARVPSKRSWSGRLVCGRRRYVLHTWFLIQCLSDVWYDFLTPSLCCIVALCVAPPPVPVRPASPLPPGVPTGPRNQNKYKDRDGNAPAVDGLDYGGNNKDLGGRTPSGEPEDRGSSRYVLSFL